MYLLLLFLRVRLHQVHQPVYDKNVEWNVLHLSMPPIRSQCSIEVMIPVVLTTLPIEPFTIALFVACLENGFIS